MDNSTYLLRLYKKDSLWCFDDPERGLVAEPFVDGIDTMIDRLLALDSPGVERPLLMFSTEPIVGGTDLMWEEQEMRNGEPWNRYYCRRLGISGCLCPVLLDFYPTPPPFLHARLVNWPHIKAPAFKLFRGDDGSSEHTSSKCPEPLHGDPEFVR